MNRTGITVEGVDEVVRDFAFRSAALQPAAKHTVVQHAERAAQKMRDRVPIGETRRTLESITADEHATESPEGVYADAGPEWFVARFLEHGTVHMPPRPFVGPAADEQFPEFERDMDRLTPE